jgi:microcystin-dependent protein
MSWPTVSARTKTWITEVLTGADLHTQYDLLHSYLNDLLSGTSGHDHRGTDGYGQKVNLNGASIGVTGILGQANGGTGASSGFITGSPIGSYLFWSLASAPTNYLACDGSAISRTTYASLFGVIGTTYGVGDGSTTFTLPDCKGKVLVGYDSAETEFDAIGETGGAKTHTLSTTEMPAHTHTKTIATGGLNGGGVPTGWSADVGNGTGTGTTDSTGGGGAHNNLPPYITALVCIRYQ